MAAVEQLLAGGRISHLRELLDVRAGAKDCEVRRCDDRRADLVARLDLVPERRQVADHLRRDRVGGGPVEPQDRQLVPGLEQQRLLLLGALVGARIEEEALAGLLSQPALVDEPPQERRRRESVAPLALGQLEAPEHRVKSRLVGTGERPGQDPGPHHHPELDVLGRRHCLVDQHHGLHECLQLEALDDGHLARRGGGLHQFSPPCL